MLFASLLNMKPKSYQIPPYRLLAILLSMSVLLRFFEEGLQLLFLFLTFVLLFSPDLRVVAWQSLTDIVKTVHGKMIIIVLIFCLPSVIFSIDIAQSFRTWFFTIILLGLCAGLNCFQYAPKGG